MTMVFDKNWGPRSPLNSKSWLLAIEQDDVTISPDPLPSHGWGSVSQNLIEALLVPQTYVNDQGNMATRYVIARPAEETHREYKMMFPKGVLYSPAKHIAEHKRHCMRDIFALYLCPEDSQYNHFIAYRRVSFSTPVESEDFVTQDDNNAFGEESTATLEQRLVKFGIFGQQVADAQVDTAAAIAIGKPGCADCTGKLYDYVLTGGGSGSGAPEVTSSVNAAQSFAAVTVTGAAADNYVTDIYRDGDVIILTLADTLDPTTATAGEIAVSLDGGTTWTIVDGPSNAMFAVGPYGGVVLAGGCDGELWRSADYINWTQLSVPAALAAKHFTDVAEDKVSKVAYLSMTGGGAVAVTDQLVGDLSTPIGVATALNTVAVLDAGHIVFAGAGGVFKESTDGGSTFTTKTVAGTTDDIVRVRGTKYRVVVAAGQSLYERSQLTNMQFAAMRMRLGQTIGADIADLDTAPGINGDNYFAAIDVAGDVYIFRPQFPGA